MVGTSNESDPEMASECIWVFSIPKAISWGPCYKAIAQKSWLPAGEIRQYRRYFHSQTYNMSMFGKKIVQIPSSTIYHLPNPAIPTKRLRHGSVAPRFGWACTVDASDTRGIGSAWSPRPKIPRPSRRQPRSQATGHSKSLGLSKRSQPRNVY